MKKYFKKFAASLIFSAFAFLTVVFFAPVEVYLGNTLDFQVAIDSVIKVLGVLGLGATLAFSIIISFLPVKVLKFVNLSVFALTLCCYIQSLFLNGSLMQLNGEENTIAKSTYIYNIAIWVGIVVLVFVCWFIFKKLKKEKAYITATKLIAVALVIMQFTGFASLLLKYDNSTSQLKTLYLSSEGRLELAKENNVVCFVLDYADNETVNLALKQDPKMFDGLEGFTFYPDHVFIHGRTFPALTYLLTQQKYYYDIPYQEYIDSAAENSEFLNTLNSVCDDIRVYTEAPYLGLSAMEEIDNLSSNYSNNLDDLKLLGFIKSTAKISAFREMPYLLKDYFAYKTEDVNKNSLIPRDDVAPVNDDYEFYTTIKEKRLSINETYGSAFRLYHMFGPHPGATINENAEYVPEATMVQAMQGDMKIIKAYIEQLKELGVYDNTTIIITADHGYFLGNVEMPQNCLLLVKNANADTTVPLKTSEAQVSQEDYFPSVIKAFGGDYSKFGVAYDDVSETEDRTRYHYNTEINSNWEETLLKEYSITGDGRKVKNYKPTGNEWDIKFSRNLIEE